LQNAPAVVEATPSKLAVNAGPRRQVSTLPSSCKGDGDCARMLGALINDPKRGWLTEPQSATEYANGARFFAYRALRHTLSCRELILASQDLTIAADRLSAPGTAVSTARAASALSLSTAVAAELRNEMTDRC
jgi:hypothetical protein